MLVCFFLAVVARRLALLAAIHAALVPSQFVVFEHKRTLVVLELTDLGTLLIQFLK